MSEHLLPFPFCGCIGFDTLSVCNPETAVGTGHWWLRRADLGWVVGREVAGRLCCIIVIMFIVPGPRARLQSELGLQLITTLKRWAMTDNIKPTSTLMFSMQNLSWAGFSQATVQRLISEWVLCCLRSQSDPKCSLNTAPSALFCIACNIPKQCLTSQLVWERTVNLKSKLMDCEIHITLSPTAHSPCSAPIYK